MNKALLEELLNLSPAERIELAQELWDSIPPASADVPPLTSDQEAEIARRMADHKRDPARAVPWEAVRSRLRARFA